MNSGQKYLVFVRSAFSSDLKKVDCDRITGVHRPMTLRDYIDRSFKHLLKVMPETFLPVKASDFIKDYSLEPEKSVYIKRLGWNYSKAAALVKERGSLLMYTCHPDHPWRFAALDDYRLNDEIAFRILREIEDGLGLETVLEEYPSSNAG
ncbi:MAG: hypothetical protein LBQ54_08420 [Planctomycetaceae bacterium]|jgi:hypothetical protein|nr:hypothetical protein [Planctomycetaceae bacterium]